MADHLGAALALNVSEALPSVGDWWSMDYSQHDDTAHDASRQQRDAECCVWMTAGVLSYRLCTKNFDCDNCPVDRILSGRDGQPAASVEEVPQLSAHPVLEHLSVPIRRCVDLHYHPAHLWARQVEPGRVRLGLDDFRARLAETSESWRFPSIGTLLTTGDCFAETRVDGEVIRAASPMPGKLVARNHALRAHPALATWSPYGAGWMVELETDAELSPRYGFMHDHTVVQGWFDAELERLAACCRNGAEFDAELGPTMHDGGLPQANLRDLLGEAGYIAALKAFCT